MASVRPSVRFVRISRRSYTQNVSPVTDRRCHRIFRPCYPRRDTFVYLLGILCRFYWQHFRLYISIIDFLSAVAIIKCNVTCVLGRPTCNFSSCTRYFLVLVLYCYWFLYDIGLQYFAVICFSVRSHYLKYLCWPQHGTMWEYRIILHIFKWRQQICVIFGGLKWRSGLNTLIYIYHVSTQIGTTSQKLAIQISFSTTAAEFLA